MGTADMVGTGFDSFDYNGTEDNFDSSYPGIADSYHSWGVDSVVVIAENFH